MAFSRQGSASKRIPCGIWLMSYTISQISGSITDEVDFSSTGPCTVIGLFHQGLVDAISLIWSTDTHQVAFLGSSSNRLAVQ